VRVEAAQHAILARVVDSYRLKDLNSTNGHRSTYLLTRGRSKLQLRGEETRPSKLVSTETGERSSFRQRRFIMSDFGLRFGTNSMSPMTLDEYEKLPSEEKEHFAILPSPSACKGSPIAKLRDSLNCSNGQRVFSFASVPNWRRDPRSSWGCPTQLKSRPRVRAIGRARQRNTSDATGEPGTRRHQ
jgi:hypothetical protein